MKIVKYGLLLAGMFCFSATHAQQPAYKNKNLSPEQRAKNLLSLMTVDEKVMQTQCLWIQKSRILNAAGDFDEAKAKEALKNGLGELGRLNENAGPNSSGYHPRQAAELYNKIQRYFVEKTRLGIPVMTHEESLHGQQTQDA
ncbi:MAG TPA: glycoside hydrolase family 3 N-terminal domain-containing protein, partial [Ferruginibacter sp.]|nr:glycoside hydrolase family 3 N-terminal domain-containing protein [Ferruginibacter sp.]